MEEQLNIIALFKDFPIWEKCPVDLKKPERIFWIMGDFGRETEEERPHTVYFALEICDGNTALIERFNVKKRQYIGTTSMDSELSLLIANQALARPATLAYDPFAGTGSLLVVCAHFGCMSLGGDIDVRMLKGEDTGPNVQSNFVQYGVPDRLLDLFVGDNARPCMRQKPMFDAIVADPPYGVREGARKVGKKKKAIEREKTHPKPQNPETKHISSCVAYASADVLKDLLSLAARMLVMGGRLVYWLATTNEYTDKDLPLHPCLRLVSNCEQPLSNKWRRRLITMVKDVEYDESVHGELDSTDLGQRGELAHSNLKAKIFPGRRKKGDTKI
jgi:tRNA (guanine10-N2)-methyltransferase